MDIQVTPTPLSGVLVVDVKFFEDERGFFLEAYHRPKFAAAGLTAEFVQDNHSRSGARVLRGLHYQDLTAPMGKLVRCTRGAIFDVAVDLRLGSPTFARWFGVELTEANKRQLWIPVGFAHGFVTLSELADVQYKCSHVYAPTAERTLAWDDPEVAVAWPVTDPVLSQRDRQGQSLSQYRQNPAFHYEG